MAEPPQKRSRHNDSSSHPYNSRGSGRQNDTRDHRVHREDDRDRQRYRERSRDRDHGRRDPRDRDRDRDPRDNRGSRDDYRNRDRDSHRPRDSRGGRDDRGGNRDRKRPRDEEEAAQPPPIKAAERSRSRSPRVDSRDRGARQRSMGSRDDSERERHREKEPKRSAPVSFKVGGHGGKNNDVRGGGGGEESKRATEHERSRDENMDLDPTSASGAPSRGRPSTRDHYTPENSSRNEDSRRREYDNHYAEEQQEDDDDDIEIEADEDADAMAAMMGFGGFGTTKQKKVAGNDVGAVRKEKKTEYRQYMNRVGGFNRPLSPGR